MFLKYFMLGLTLVFAVFTVLSIKLYTNAVDRETGFTISSTIKQFFDMLITNVIWLILIIVVFGIKMYIVPLATSYILEPVFAYLISKNLYKDNTQVKLLIVFSVIAFFLECLGIIMLTGVVFKW